MLKVKEEVPVSLSIDAQVYAEYKDAVKNAGYKLKHVSTKIFEKALKDFVATSEVPE